MIREKLFEFAREKGWYDILEVAHNVHFLPDIASRINKKEKELQIDLRFMCSMGLLQLSKKAGGGYLYSPTVLGIRFMQEENKKVGRTFSCQLCGTTTGTPHVCSVFYPEFK